MTNVTIERVKALYDDPTEPHPTEHAHKRLLYLLEEANRYTPIPRAAVAVGDGGGIWVYFGVDSPSIKCTLIQDGLGDTKLWVSRAGLFFYILHPTQLVNLFNYIDQFEHMDRNNATLFTEFLDTMGKPVPDLSPSEGWAR